MSLSGWLGPRLAARPVLEPFPGWVLGSGQRVGSANRFRRELWPLLRQPFAVPWLENLELFLYPGNETSCSVFVTGRYEPNEFCLLQRILKPGMTFIDAGANMGLYSVFAARRVSPGGTVVSIEPSGREFAILEKNVKLNALTNVRMRHKALADRSAELELSVAPLGKSGHNTLGAFAYDTPLDHRERVKAEKLDDLVHSEGLARVDVIKMDIEGAEMAALRGAEETLRQFKPVLLIEISDRSLQHQGASSREVLALLEQQGYRIYCFDAATAMPVPLTPRPYFDSENLVAVAGDATPW
ncbi:MAG TPA: FkbM family methyltransferase [Candidatus Sulfotelmatobacter sp.]|nr:FkbM family methyltransferase [Candidatus Sulfotelmatobacter sp.]